MKACPGSICVFSGMCSKVVFSNIHTHEKKRKKNLLLLYAIIIFYRAAINVCFRIVIFFGFVLTICRDESMMLFFYWQYLYVFLCVSQRIFFLSDRAFWFNNMQM